jgi:hypothetical protein
MNSGSASGLVLASGAFDTYRGVASGPPDLAGRLALANIERERSPASSKMCSTSRARRS